MITICPACGKRITDSDDHIWYYLGKEYCTEKCVRTISK